MSLMTYTRATILAEVRNQLRTPSTGTISDANIITWIDKGCLDVSVRTKCIRADCTGTSVSGQQKNTIPAECLGAKTISRLEFDGAVLQGPVPFNEIDERLKGNALSAQGAPKFWVPYGRAVYFYPIPASAYHDKTMHLYCAIMSDAMAASGTTLASLGIPELYGPAIETFARHKGLLKLGEEAKALEAWKLYLMQVGQAADQRMPDVNIEATAGAG